MPDPLKQTPMVELDRDNAIYERQTPTEQALDDVALGRAVDRICSKADAVGNIGVEWFRTILRRHGFAIVKTKVDPL